MRGAARRSGYIAELAEYVTAAARQRVSGPAKEAALRCVFDLLTAAAAGVRETAPTATRRVAAQMMGPGSIPIWFSGQSSTLAGAAWANSAAAAALDLDDGHRLARGHPGAAVIPVALAAGQQCSAPLDRILAAIVIGYEVGVTIAAARTSYGNTGTWASFAVVATVAALRGTPTDILEHALAIAGESAPNQLFASASPPRDPDPEGSDVKEGIPWSVMTGLAALSLAEAGHSGPRNILDSTRHYRFPEKLSLGEMPHICQTYFKLYACCRHIHAPLDAMLTLIGTHNIQPARIEQIAVETTSGALRISNRPRPENIIDAQYSVPYCLALAAHRGAASLLPLTGGLLRDETIGTMAEKVTLSLNPEFDARFPAETLARVTILHAGSRYMSEITSPRGEASDPLSWAEMREKCRAAIDRIATGQQAELLLGAADMLRADDLSGLNRLTGELQLTATCPEEAL